MTKRSSSILTSRWTSRRVESEVGGGELKMLKKRKLAWLEQRDKDGQSCSNLYPYHKTAAHFHMTLLSFFTIASTESFSHLGYFFKLRLWPNPHNCIAFRSLCIIWVTRWSFKMFYFCWVAHVAEEKLAPHWLIWKEKGSAGSGRSFSPQPGPK